MRKPAREYKVIKVPYGAGNRYSSYVVVSEDLVDPNVWVVIDRFFTVNEAFRYVNEVTQRNGANA